MSSEAQLEALLEIVNTSVRRAIAEYKKGGYEVPTIQSKTYHPLDFAADAVALRNTVKLLESACLQLCTSLAPPQHTVINYSASFDWAYMRVVVRVKVADVLEHHPNGLHVDELAQLVNLEKGKLARVLRHLATKGCFSEIKPDIFANNRVSLALLSSCDASALSRVLTEDVSQGAGVLYETMTEPEYAASSDPEKAPVIYALRKKGLKGNFFGWLKEDAERREVYHRAMIGGSRVMGSLSVLYHYSWDEVKTVCDVGAGVGAISQPLAKMYPHLKVICQDLPEVSVQAKDIWAKNAPEAIQANQVEFVPFNFLEESPVHGLDIYYMHNIIHDWPDAEAAVILRNVKKAMVSNSRLLIQGCVLASASRNPTAQSSGLNLAPEPMIANFGNAAYQQDLVMWLTHNAKERTLDESIALGSAAGLKLEKVYDLAASAVLEFRVAT